MPIYEISYPVDGLHLKALIALPAGFTFKFASWVNDEGVSFATPPEQSDGVPVETMAPLPGLVYCRGGIGHVGKVKTDWMRRFASHGFVVFAPYYRGSQSGCGRDEFGGLDVVDVIRAFELLCKLEIVDPSRISLMGFSRGAINAAKTALSVKPHRLVLWGGVSDLKQTYEQRVDLRRMLRRVIGGTPTKVPVQYIERSPIGFAESTPCPVLLIHGEHDEQVLVEHSDAMFAQLVKAKKSVKYLRLKGFGHHLPPPVHEAVVDYMMEYLTGH